MNVARELERMIGQAPISLACSSGQGYAGGDLRYTGLTSTKGARTTHRQPKAPVNVRTAVGLTTGYVKGADVQTDYASGAPINSRHARRRMANGTQRRKTA